jgi:hypothetical protein
MRDIEEMQTNTTQQQQDCDLFLLTLVATNESIPQGFRSLHEVDTFVSDLSRTNQNDLEQICSVLCAPKFFHGLTEITSNKGFPQTDFGIVLSGLSALVAARTLLSRFTNDHFDCLAAYFSSVRFDQRAALDSLCDLMKSKQSHALASFCQDDQVTSATLRSKCPDLESKPFIIPGVRTLLQNTTKEEYDTLCLCLSSLNQTEKSTLKVLQDNGSFLYRFRRTLCPLSCPPPAPLEIIRSEVPAYALPVPAPRPPMNMPLPMFGGPQMLVGPPPGFPTHSPIAPPPPPGFYHPQPVIHFPTPGFPQFGFY